MSQVIVIGIGKGSAFNMKNKNSMNKTRKLLLGVLCSSAIFFGFTSSVSHAEYTDISIQEEKSISSKSIQKLKDSNTVTILSNKNLERIQKEIMDANPSLLGKEDHTERFLKPVMFFDFKGNVHYAGNLNDGYIALSKSAMQFMNQYSVSDDSQQNMRENNPEDIYNNSEIAFNLAHESAHWENKEKYHAESEEETKQEQEADKKAVDYLARTSFYGIGGGLIDFSRYEALKEMHNYKPMKKNIHLSDNERFQYLSDRIKEDSKEVLTIKKSGEATYGKERFNNTGFAPSKKGEVNFSERTMYVVGQISFAMKNNVWDLESARIKTQDEVFKNGSQDIVLAVKNPLSLDRKGIKVIDKFNISKKRANELLSLLSSSKDTSFLKNATSEETYFVNLMLYLVG